MMTKPRACVLHAPGDLRVEERELPLEVGDDAGLLEVEVTGVCGADVELYRGHSGVAFDPIVLGHEVVGRIGRIGAQAAARWGVGPGDRVVVNEVIACGRCRLCVEGRNELCNGFFGTDGSRYGFIPVGQESGLWGGFSTHMQLHPNTQLWPIADHVPTSVAAMFMPVSNGVHWLFELAGVGPADTVLVLGPGPQGLAVTAVGALSSVRMLVAGRSGDATRLELAKRVGAAATIDSEAEDTVAIVKELTGGRGVDAVVIATSGATTAMQVATRCAAIGGVIVTAGTNGWRSEEGFKADALVFRDLTVRGAPGHSVASVGRAVRLLEASPDAFTPLVGEEVGLDGVAGLLGGVAAGGPGGVHTSVNPGHTALGHRPLP